MVLLSKIKNRTPKESRNKAISLRLKTEIRELFTIVKNHRKSRATDVDTLAYKTLEDDLYIAYKTIDTYQSTMFCAARGATQLRQCSYNPSDFSDTPTAGSNVNTPMRMMTRCLPIDTSVDDDDEYEARPEPAFRRQNAMPLRVATNGGFSAFETDGRPVSYADADADDALFKDYVMLDSTQQTQTQTQTMSDIVRQISRK